ncbi:ferredoxin [Amnibacterium sp.]|uniref:NADH-quinone oxidoreductase subunit B family protein n=1 Tax=Amnibacterium sp. TaxID=1872496 RepID=UPI003F7B3769
MSWVSHGLRNGVLTTGWPRRSDAYFDELPAGVQVDEHADAPADLLVATAAACPTGAIEVEHGVRVDRGRCILCGRCAELAPAVFRLGGPSATARAERSALVVPERPDSAAELADVRRRLADRVRALRRSVHIRHVDAGSDGSEEWEVQALTNPVYDIHRLGIFFTASPRHADLLLVTGIGTAGMTAALRRTREAMPDPVVVVACGTDAVSGGLMGRGYTEGHGVGPLLDVDVWVPGSPPPPFAILHGILLALGRVGTAS